MFTTSATSYADGEPRDRYRAELEEVILIVVYVGAGAILLVYFVIQAIPPEMKQLQRALAWCCRPGALERYLGERHLGGRRREGDIREAGDIWEAGDESWLWIQLHGGAPAAEDTAVGGERIVRISSGWSARVGRIARSLGSAPPCSLHPVPTVTVKGRATLSSVMDMCTRTQVLSLIVLSPMEFFSQGYPFKQRLVELAAAIIPAMINENPSDEPMDAPPITASSWRRKMNEELVAEKFRIALAAARGNGASAVVLPDVGCGGSTNDPSVVGRIFGKIFLEHLFEDVEYYCEHPGLLRDVVLCGTCEFQEAVETTVEREAARRPALCLQTRF
jgi:hypothetical protein